MISSRKISVLKDYILNSKSIIVCSHKSPDGDAVGSLIALSNYLSALKTNIYMLLPDKCPQFLSFIPKTETILDKNSCADFHKMFFDADLIISVDFNDINRIERFKELFLLSKAKKVCIDHHPICDNSLYDLIFNDENVSSAAELLYGILKKLNLTDFNYDIAMPIYVGMMTDTGAFSYNCNSPATYRILSELFSFGIDAHSITNFVYNNFPPDRLRLWAYIFNHNLVINEEKRYAYFYVTKEELDRFNYKDGYLESAINVPLNNNGIDVVASFSNRTDKGSVKISFRSKGCFDVNMLSKTFFNGGGHANAAGADWNGSIPDAIKLFVDVIENKLL